LKLKIPLRVRVWGHVDYALRIWVIVLPRILAVVVLLRILIVVLGILAVVLLRVWVVVCGTVAVHARPIAPIRLHSLAFVVVVSRLGRPPNRLFVIAR
jgi:hypothetical protein